MKRLFTSPQKLLLALILFSICFISCKKVVLPKKELQDVSSVRNWYNLYTANIPQDFAIFTPKSSVGLLKTNNSNNNNNKVKRVRETLTQFGRKLKFTAVLIA